VQDIGTGLLVADIAACEAACDAEAACNTVSFYTTIVADTEKNCYLKTLGDSCALPTDANMDPDAILSLKCTGGLAAAPPATVPPATAAFATPPETEETGTTDTTRDTGDLATSAPPSDGASVTATPSGVASVCTGLAAVAFAGAVAVL
jgi:PAN domain